MTLEFTNKQFRRLLDLVYIGNWILNSTRGDQRFADYDEVESLVFGKALVSGMPALAEVYEGEIVPSRAFAEGGIHEAIMEYENNVFFDILAEDLAFCLRLRPSGPCPLFWPPPPPWAETWAQGRPSPPGCPGGPAPGRPPRR